MSNDPSSLSLARVVARHGAWPSPLTAEQVTSAGVQLDQLKVTSGPDGVTAWWSEIRPAEGGRTAVVSCPVRDGGTTSTDGRQEWTSDLNSRTAVHEYGGGAWVPLAAGLLSCDYADQRIYLVPSPSAPARAITPDTGATVRYADLSPVPGADAVVCVRDVLESPDDSPRRDLVRVDLDGTVTSLFRGPHFLSTARVSPDGHWLTWLSWEHPNLPWDSTTLWLARFTGDGVTDAHVVADGQALVQPGWTPDGRLLVLAERGDWWNLHEVVLTGSHDQDAEVGHGQVDQDIDQDGDQGAARLECRWAVDAECATPAWMLGMTSWAPLGDGRVVLRHGVGLPSLSVLELSHDDAPVVEKLDVPMTSLMPYVCAADGIVVVGVSDATTPRRVLAVRPGEQPQVLFATSAPIDPAWVPQPRHVEVPGPDGRVVHAYLYPPTSPVAEAPAGELPPYVMHVHGGPTSSTAVGYSLPYLYWTTRGIGVVDVDYGGSTGYGRAYRQSLYGQWGVVDVADCAAVAAWLGEQRIADPERVVISGGSAGGWTVLSCLTRTDAFAAGTSYYGVAELELFAAETHDFESRYLDQLVGPYPEQRDLYVQRAPLTHADGIRVPVLLLQGEVDKVVPPSQSERFAEAMVANGVPHAYVLYPGEGHGFRGRAAQVHSLESELAFYGQVLGFDPPGVEPVELIRP